MTVPGVDANARDVLYGELRGEDVRLALHKARVALYENQQTMNHDWASLWWGTCGFQNGTPNICKTCGWRQCGRR